MNHPNEVDPVHGEQQQQQQAPPAAFNNEPTTTTTTAPTTGSSELTTAVLHNNLALVQQLVRSNPDPEVARHLVNSADPFGATPIHIASQEGRIEILEFLVQHGAAVNLRSGWSSNAPLHAAAVRDQVAAVQLLLKYGATVNAQNSCGVTALCDASWLGHLPTAQVLLEHGAAVNYYQNESKWTALYSACFHGHLRLARLLIQHGAILDVPDNYGVTPLCAALKQGHLEVVKLLLRAGADANRVNAGGLAPLWYALQEPKLIDTTVPLLVRLGGANVNARIVAAVKSPAAPPPPLQSQSSSSTAKQDEWTYLHWAAYHDHVHVLNVLLQCGADTKIPTANGKVALTLACEQENLDSIYLLLQTGVGDGSIVFVQQQEQQNSSTPRSGSNGNRTNQRVEGQQRLVSDNDDKLPFWRGLWQQVAMFLRLLPDSTTDAAAAAAAAAKEMRMSTRTQDTGFSWDQDDQMVESI